MFLLGIGDLGVLREGRKDREGMAAVTYLIPITASMSLLLWILVDAKESVE